MHIDTVCRLCSSCCPIVAEVIDDKLVSARRKSMVTEQDQIVCPKLNAAPEIVSSPKRLTTPLVRDDKNAPFREVGWDEALEKVAQLMEQHKRASGAKSVAWLRGMAADWGAQWDYPNRLMHHFGSPNTIGNGSVCFVGRDMAHSYVYGSMAFPEPKASQCIIVWGKNDANTTLGAAEAILAGHKNGAQLIVIDPVQTRLARKADLWLQIKPGHDGLLAMSMINEIITQELYDKEFVSQYTLGFEELKAAAAHFPAEKIARQIWLTPEQVKKVAFLYATTKPACIVDGNGLDMHRFVFDTTRAVACLRPLTGNLDKPGGDVLPQPIPVRNIQDRHLLEDTLKPITQDYHLFNTFSPTWGNQVQGCIVDAILDHKPYPLEMVIVQSGNPVISMADSQRTREAFAQVSSLVVIDLFLTETAQLADVVLPASSCFERTQLNRSSIRNNPIVLQNAVINPVGNSWPDWKIVAGIADKLGLDKVFPWKTAEEAIDYQLETAETTVADVRNTSNCLRVEQQQYEKFTQHPFHTPSGKVEFYSARLAEVGHNPVPFAEGTMENPISFHDKSDTYPFIGISGTRDIRFTNSQFRNIPSLLNSSTGPVADIHPQDSQKLGIADGDSVKISTPKGSITMQARILEVVQPGTIRLAWGWGEYDPKANLNDLTEDDVRGPITGTSTSRSFMCNICKV
ncbi:molybdopterin-containing oxidoreductase family protein [Desulfogranum japonicum]|uniref:molybdopterin-containing oxidoreductase family protein n=1 Tax=Desulfogranum japonicum TaxID=231447 RepID=UPI00041ADC8E|nr:molybdopterin-dependent oxidoreductase [Desulfogranum japonicum]